MSDKEGVKNFKEANSVSFSSIQSLLEGLRYGVATMRNYDGDELKKSLKGLKGKTFSDPQTWSLFNTSRKETETRELTIEDRKQLAMFEDYCKSFGVSILIADKPKDINILVDKYNNGDYDNIDLSKLSDLDRLSVQREMDLIKKFSFAHEGKLKVKENAAVVVFGGRDIDKIEAIVDMMRVKTLTKEKRLERVHKISDLVNSMLRKTNVPGMEVENR